MSKEMDRLITLGELRNKHREICERLETLNEEATNIEIEIARIEDNE